MKLHELATEVAKYSYKPGWKIDLMLPHGLMVAATVPDSYHPEKTVPIRGGFPFEWINPDPASLNEASVRHLVKRALQRVEEHEFDEWFRYDGKLVHDPHA
jgi:hypothetical protein